MKELSNGASVSIRRTRIGNKNEVGLRGSNSTHNPYIKAHK